MKKHFLPLLVVSSIIISSVIGQMPNLAPKPKILKVTGEPFQLVAGTAIIIDDNAPAPVRYAAEQLQKNIQKRFSIELVIADSSKQVVCKQSIILRNINQTVLLSLGDKCSEFIPDREDKYAIESCPENIYIAGSNPRAVIYGQYTFFEMLQKQGDKVVVPSVSICDWPSIKWRGRPATSIDEHLETGVLDTYLRSRFNYIDLRDGPEPDKGVFGIPPGWKFDVPKTTKMIAESHKRGMFIYGTVFCGVPSEKTEQVIKTFEELIDLGVDGLWMSFDDPGNGESTEALVRRVIQLGKEHEIAPDKIAVIPPWGSYQFIDAEWNKTIAHISGANEMVWFFTSPPSARNAVLAKQIGINHLPAWWYNWPRLNGGLLYASYGGGSKYDSKYAYFGVQSIESGWNSPFIDELKDAGNNTDTIMFWSNAIAAEYDAPVMGWWSWDPNTYNPEKTNTAIYSQVYGPSMAATAADFDSKLTALQDLFTVSRYRDWSEAPWPPILKDVSNRSAAIKLLNEMDADLKMLEANSPSQTLLEPERIEDRFFKLMRDIIVYSNKMAHLEYPEYSYGELSSRMENLIKNGKLEDAQKYLADARPVVLAELGEIKIQLTALVDMDAYFKKWNDYVSGIEYWQKILEERDKEQLDKLKSRQTCQSNYKAIYSTIDLDSLLTELANPPTVKSICELTSDDIIMVDSNATGDQWAIGNYKSKVMAIVFPYATTCKKGDKGEVIMQIKTPDYSGARRLKLQIFVNYDVPENAHTSVRQMYIMVNDKSISMRDMAVGIKGSRWITKDIICANLPSEYLKIKITVANEKDVDDYPCKVVVGPVRIIAE